MTGPGIEFVDPELLLQFAGNPREGDVDAIKESLRANGMYRPIVVNAGTYTGRPNEIIVGNHTARAVAELKSEYPSDDRWTTIPVWLLDVDDPAAKRIVLVDNKLNEKGSIDDHLVAAIVAELASGVGTGYSDEEIEELRDLLAEDEILPEVEDEPIPVIESEPDPVVADPAPAVSSPAASAEDTKTVAVTYRDDPEDTPDTADDPDPPADDDEIDPFAIEFSDEDREFVLSALISEGITATDVLHAWALSCTTGE